MKEAFPKEERVAFPLLCVMAARRGTDFIAYYSAGKPVGISFSAEYDGAAFILYLAADSAERSKGYGSRILDRLKARYQNCFIALNIEPPDEAAENSVQRRRRMAFYEKNGFYSTEKYISDKDCRYLILSYGTGFSEEKYRRVMKYMAFGLFG